MKWAHIPADDDQLALLIWALTFAIEDPFHSISENIAEMLLGKGEIGGDPGWGIHRYNQQNKNKRFQVWVDSRVSGIKKMEETYDENIVRSVTKDLLFSFAKEYPIHRNEVINICVKNNL